MHDYHEQIDELRSVDRKNSLEYVAQVTLVGICVMFGWLVLGYFEFVAWFLVVYGLSQIERYLHRRNPQPYSKRLYILYIALGTAIATCAAALPVYLWSFDGRTYLLAGMIYLVGLVLNTFFIRAQAWPALLCRAIPNGVAVFIIAYMHLDDSRALPHSILAFILATVFSVYLIVLVMESLRRVRATRETTKALLQAQKSETVANFAGGVAHDFNNLLGVIQASLEQANLEPDPSERKALIDQAIAAVGRGAGLTKQLLTVGRQTEFETRLIDMDAFTTELEQFLKRIIPSSIALTVERDPELTTIKSEPTLLQSMLLNLAMNAREAMADAGNLTISMERFEATGLETISMGTLTPGMYAVFSVKDDGKGIEPEIFGRVLEPFFSTRPIGEGTGLGLAMVSGFCQQVGGALDIASQESKGTVVRFFLPLPRALSQPQDRPAASKPLASKDKNVSLSVLLVEDEPDLNYMLDRYLTNKGYTVLSCASGDEAFACVKDGYTAHIILTDLVMPGTLQGTDLVREIRKEQPDVATILMSGYAFNQDISAFSAPDAKHSFLLGKPFKLSELDTLMKAAEQQLKL